MNKESIRKFRHAGVALACTVAISGCASVPAPDAQMTRTRAAINSADEAGARNYAPLDFREANKKFEAAQAAMKDEKYQKAGRLAEEAEIDAMLAQTRSDSAKAAASEEQLRESIKTLREEIERGETQ